MLKLVVVALGLSLFSSICIAKAPVRSFGSPQPRYAYLPHNFTVVNWNIFKGGTGGLYKDFAHITQNADVAMVQEGHDSPELLRDLSSANPEFSWNMVLGFKYKGHYTGVATGARVKSMMVEGFITTVREPILNSPKSMLLSVYPIANSTDSLAVLNVHAINFVFNSSFNKQIAQIKSILQNHRGPIVVAGDFNTWNNARLRSLDAGLGSLGLKRLKLTKVGEPGNSHSYGGLDHAYVRGLVVTEASLLQNIESSDHKPIVLRMQRLQASRQAAAF